MKKLFNFMDDHRDEFDLIMALLIAAFFFVVIISLLTGCTVRGGWPRFVRPGETPGWHAPSPPAPTNAMSIIMPPGFAPSSNVVRPRLMALVAPPVVATTNVVLTCDVGAGRFDGVNIYNGMEPDRLSLILTIVGPNPVASVTIPIAYPTLLEARTFINWPAPGVVNCFTNDDGSTGCVTNTYYENPVGTDLIYVPVGCPNQWVFLNRDGTTSLVGWGLTNFNYTVRSGQLDGPMVPVFSFSGTNGPWRHDATGEGPYWATTYTNQ